MGQLVHWMLAISKQAVTKAYTSCQLLRFAHSYNRYVAQNSMIIDH